MEKKQQSTFEGWAKGSHRTKPNADKTQTKAPQSKFVNDKDPNNPFEALKNLQRQTLLSNGKSFGKP